MGVYTQQNGGRLEYIEHLKEHYNDKSNNLTYLECELCLKEPTKNNLKKKKKLELDGTAKLYPNQWRTSSHVANFISHIAGHLKRAGFYCNVKVWSEQKQKYIRCGATASTTQNLAKHVYGAHYKCFDENEEFTVDPNYGYCRISSIPKGKRKRKQTSVRASNNKKRCRHDEYECDENEEYVPVPKKRKILKRKAKMVREENGLMIPSSIGHQCLSLEQQRTFVDFMVLADFVCADKKR